MEDVNDEVYVIKQGPPAGCDTLHVVRPSSSLSQRLYDVISQCPDVGVGRSRGDDEKVGRVTQRSQIEYHDLESLSLVERARCQLEVAALVLCYPRVIACCSGDGSASLTDGGSSI